MSLAPTNRNKSCPICENTSGKCRQGKSDPNYWQCMTYADAKKGEVVGEYKCIGTTKNQQWGQFKPDNSQEWTEEKRREWQIENQRRKAAQARVDEQRRQRSLSAASRHEQYTKLLAELTLHPDDRADLIRRGFTHEQIELSGFKSIGRYQKLQSRYSELLPGINRGDRLVIRYEGYLCPIRNADGLIVACQVRLRTLPTNESGRYRWLSGGNQTLHLYPAECQPEGELPLPVFRPQGKPEGIALAEGTGAKPFLVAQRFNLFTIGATGGQWASSLELFREILEKAIVEVEKKEILIFPDAGDIRNPSVMNRWQRVIALLQEWGWLVKIVWWGQVSKDHPDIDELDNLSSIIFVSTEDFLSWVESAETDKSASTKTAPKTPPQSTFIPNQPQSKDKSQNPGKAPSTKTNQESYSSPRSTIFDISNPPLIASFPTHSLRDGLFKVLPIPESVASCWTTEEKAPGKTRRWFERILKRVKKVFSKSAKKDKAPQLGFNCFKEPNPDFEEKIRRVQRQLRSLSYEADINLASRYLPNELVNQLPKSGLIGIKAPKGCGKSVLLKKIIALAKKQGIPVLSITPRIALGREQAIKWEITWIDDYGVMQTKADDTARQIAEIANKRAQAKEKLAELEKISYQQLNVWGQNERDDIEQQKGNLRAEIEQYDEQIENINAASIKTLALCWDSLWRTKDRNLSEALIVIDEAELGFKHFISGSTCKRNRPYLLKVFKDKLVECLMSGGRVILSDADLTDLPINYVREILPIPIKPFIVKNEYIGDETRWLIDLRVNSRGCTLDEILERIKDGDYLAITTDSKAEAQALEKLILQELPDEFCAFLDDSGNITKEAQAREKALIIRVDRTTTEAEAGKAFIQKPNDQILHWKPRLLIYTPSMGVGVSVDEHVLRWDEDQQEMVPYFDAVYGLFFGVIEPAEARQQLARIRANVPRIVYCKMSNKALEGCSSFFPEEVARQTLKYNHSALSVLDIAKGIAGYDADDEEIREAMLQLLNEAWDKNSRCWKEPGINLGAAFKARENYGLWNLANLLREELEVEGHEVITLSGMKTDLVEELTEIKDELKLEEATLLAESTTMPVEDAKKILNKLGATKEEHRSAQKTLLQDELPGVELTPAFIKKAVVNDRRRWLNQQKLFWYFTNDEAVRQVDTDNWLSNLKRFAEGTPFMRDIRSYSPKVEALRKCGIFEFIDLKDGDRVYQHDTPEAQTFLKRCLKHKDLLQTALNVLVTKKSSPIALANRILGKVRLALEKLTRSNKDSRWKLATDLVNDLDRTNVLKAFGLRWQMSQEDAAQKTAEKQAQPQSQTATQPGGEVADCIYTDQTSPPNFEIESQGDIAQPSASYAASFEVESQGAAVDLCAEDEAPLDEALSYCQSASHLALIVEWYHPSRELMEDAIALQDSQPRRQQLAAWYAALVNVANDTDSSLPLPQKPSIEVSNLTEDALALQELPSTPKVFSVGQRLKGLRYSFAGKIAQVTETFGDWCETTLGTVAMSEVGSCWEFA